MRNILLIPAVLTISVGAAPGKKPSSPSPAKKASTTDAKGGNALLGVDSSQFGGLAVAAPARKLVAVVPLASGNLPRDQADLIGDALGTALQQRGGVRMMERSQMEKILQEQGFQNSGACDKSECAVQMGKLLGIDQIVVGSVGRLGGSYLLNARRVDVATGEILGSTSRTVAGRIEQVTAELPMAAADLYAPPGSAPTPAAAASAPLAASAPRDSESYEVEVIEDQPESPRLLLRASAGVASYWNIALFAADGEASIDLKLVKGLHLEASYLQDYWAMDDRIPTTYSRNGDSRNLPLATAESGDPSLREISCGLTWLFHSEDAKEIQTKPMRSEVVASSIYLTVVQVHNIEVPLVVQRGTGLRGGVILDRHPVEADQGNGKMLVSSDPSKLVLANGRTVGSIDSTNGWTYQRNSIAYLGLSRETRQGSVFEVTRRETGEKIRMRNFVHTAWYADLMLAVQSDADPVKYEGTSYKISQGDQDGQVPSSLWGLRVGYLYEATRGAGLQFRAELGKWPGSGAFYMRTAVGLDFGI